MTDELKQQLTDEELDTLTQTLAENVSEDAQAVRDLKNNEELAKECEELQSEVVTVTASQETGEILVTETEDIHKDTDLSITDIAEGKLGEKNEEAFTENVKNAITNQFELSDAEVGDLLTVIMRYKAGEQFSVYNALPLTIKNLVNKLAMESGASRNQYNMFATMIIEQFINDANIDQEFVDFQKSLEQELKIPSVIDMYTEHLKERMEVKVLESADRLQEEYPEKAETLRQISKVFTESYKLNRLKEYFDSNAKLRRKIATYANQCNRYCGDFNYKIKDSQYKINDPSIMVRALNKVLPNDITTEDVKKFVVLFCKSCENLDASNIVDCAYMYYTVKNIVTLEYSDEVKTDFSKELISNIIDLINYIKEDEKARQEVKNNN